MVNLSKEEIAKIKAEEMKIWVDEQLKLKRERLRESEKKRLEVYGDGSNFNKALRGGFHLSKQGLSIVKKIVKSK